MALYAFDGTWNKPDADSDTLDENTNVYNFLRYYAPGDAEASAKLEEYETGVGTRFGEPGRIVGGFFGAGGRDRVHELVESFKRNWARNGPEDRTVDVIGFSRGAALALHFCNQLAHGVEVGGEKVKPPIRFLGLWDVVPSFGLPGVLIKELNDINFGWELDVPGTVQNCFHAMALDERRGAFNVHRLDPENDDAPRIQEVWFRGVHSDVGGGNGNVLRGNITLVWMLRKAHGCGVPIALDEVAKLKFQLDAPVSHGDMQGRWQDRAILKGDTIDASAGRKLAVGERVRAEVDSQLWFDFTGVLVEQGARYRFTPDLSARWNDGVEKDRDGHVTGKGVECDASGWPADLGGKGFFERLKEKVLQSRVAGLTRRVPEANWFEMVACVGACAKPSVPTGRGQFAQQSWTCTASGPLFFFANDARLSGFGHSFYDNNQGVIGVSIERVA